MRFPGEVYQNSSRTFQGTPEELIYPGMARRQVDKHGRISWQNQRNWAKTKKNRNLKPNLAQLRRFGA
jgi:hypothetical protein